MPEYSAIYETAIDRIRSSYYTCSAAEQKMLRQILQEMSQTGYSYTLEQCWLSDFKELPVSIDQFLSDSEYLGQATNGGQSVYPYWKGMMKDLFDNGNRYNEIILSGATRIGKTSTAITILSYMLYRLMLYRDPHTYFNKKPTARFTLVFANLTKELANGVAFFEFNSTIKESPWFMRRGVMNKSVNNPVYMPEGDKINILPCSDAAHALGMQIWGCLKGDTKLLTTEGIKSIEECVSSTQEVIQYSDTGLISTQAEVVLTKFTDELIRVELEDGTVLEGTPDHKVLLSNGTYKPLGDLTSSDDLLTFNIDTEVDHMNLSCYDSKFLVYVHTSPKGKKYVGITSKSPQERWGKGGLSYKSNIHFWNAICKYGWDNFTHEIVANNLTLIEACDLEVRLISEYDATNPDKGYNHTTGGNWSRPDEETRKRLSRSIKKSRACDPTIQQRINSSLKGHSVSAETRHKISKANKGRKLTEEQCLKRRGRELSADHIAKLKGHPSWCKGLTKETDIRLKNMSVAMKGREIPEEQRKRLSEVRRLQYINGYSPVWITDGNIETSIQKGDDIPEGFRLGRLNKKDTYIHKGNKSKKIARNELDSYISKGWLKGRPDRVKESIRKSLQLMHWEYEGIRFERAEDLAQYLRTNGYPNIVSSTITSLTKKGFDKSPTYKSLAGKVKCIYHEN